MTTPRTPTGYASAAQVNGLVTRLRALADAALRAEDAARNIHQTFFEVEVNAFLADPANTDPETGYLIGVQPITAEDVVAGITLAQQYEAWMRGTGSVNAEYWRTATKLQRLE